MTKHRILLNIETDNSYDANGMNGQNALTDVVAGRLWSAAGVKDVRASRLDGESTYYILSEAEYNELQEFKFMYEGISK
jgi:hypothetical protein